MSQPMHTIYSSRTADKFVVRLPGGMRDRIAAVSHVHHRSMNSEIISRLESSLSDSPAVEYPDGDATKLSARESRLVEMFRGLAPQQRTALLEIISIPGSDNASTQSAND